MLNSQDGNWAKKSQRAKRRDPLLREMWNNGNKEQTEGIQSGPVLGNVCTVQTAECKHGIVAGKGETEKRKDERTK